MSETAAPYVTESSNADHPPDRYPVPWTCEKDHVLGQVIRRNGITRLQLFRLAIRPDNYDQIAVKIVGIVSELTGTADWVKCSICGATRTWIASEAGIKQLLERRSVREAEKL